MFTTYKWSISSGLAAAADCCVSIECFDFFSLYLESDSTGFFFLFYDWSGIRILSCTLLRKKIFTMTSRLPVLLMKWTLRPKILVYNLIRK